MTFRPLHDRILVKLFSGAKHKHQQQFQKQGKAINDKVRLYSKIGQALLEAKENGSDPYAAVWLLAKAVPKSNVGSMIPTWRCPSPYPAPPIRRRSSSPAVRPVCPRGRSTFTA